MPRIPIVSIDFGTSRTAMVISNVGEETVKQNLVIPKDNMGNHENTTQKIPSAVLLRLNKLQVVQVADPSDVDLIAFGDNAGKVYSAMNPETKKSHIFCKWFKMALHQKIGARGLSHDPLISSPSTDSCGAQVLMSVVITKMLELFKKAAIDFFRCLNDEDLVISDAIWVLTVPAIWRSVKNI